MCVGLIYPQKTHISFKNLDESFLIGKNRFISRNPKKEEEKIKINNKKYKSFGFSSGNSEDGMIAGANEKGVISASISVNGISPKNLSKFQNELLSLSSDSEGFSERGEEFIENGYFSPDCGGVLLFMDEKGKGFSLEIHGKESYCEEIENTKGYTNSFQNLKNEKIENLKYPEMREEKLEDLLNENLSMEEILSNHERPVFCRHKEDDWKHYTRSNFVLTVGDGNVVFDYDGPICRTEPNRVNLNELWELDIEKGLYEREDFYELIDNEN